MSKNENARANENANANENATTPQRRQRRQTAPAKKGGIGGKIVCLLLGFVMGVVGTIGGIGGLGYYAVSEIKIRDAFSTVNNLAGLDLDYTEYINEQYGDNSVLDLIENVSKEIAKLQTEKGCLNTLNGISPMVGSGVQKLIETVSSFGITIEYDDLMSTPFADLGDFLGTTVQNTDIARLIECVTENPVEGMLAMICYGEKGEDYIVNDDGSITMLGGATSATIGSLTNAEELAKRLNGLSFLSMMESLGGVNADDPIIRTLVYGTQDVDYTLNGDGSVTPLPKTYDLNTSLDTSNPDRNVFTAPDGTRFTLDASNPESVSWVDQAQNRIVPLEDDPDYQFAVLDSASNVIYNLKSLEKSGDITRYQAYIDGVAQVRKGPYLSDIIGENADLLAVIGDVRLGDILKLNGSSDPIMLAVAYGEKGKDYTVDEKTNIIHPITKPITINDMIGGDGMDIVKDIPLGTLLDIQSPLQQGVEPLMIILAFGEKGTHYDTKIVNGAETWYWKINPETGEEYTQRTVGYLIAEGNESLFSDLTIESLMNVNASSDNLMRALAYGNENTHYVLTSDNKVEMLPMRYFVSQNEPTKVYDEEHIFIGTLGAEIENGIYPVAISSEKTQYIKARADGVYDVFFSVDDAKNYAADNDTRLYHTKTRLIDLRGSGASTAIERIELAAALDVHIFGTGEDTPDPLMVQLAFGVQDKHYSLDTVNKKIIWLKDEDPTSDTYGLYFHARTIHDMKDTHTLIESIYLDTALELNASSPAIMLALAYGNDYTIDGDKVIYTERKTIADLMGNNAKALIEGIHLDTALGLTASSPAIMLALAYGNDYTINGDTVTYTKVNTLGDLMGSQSKDLIENIEMNKIITADADDAVMNYILYGTTKGANDPAAQKRTLGQFMNNSSTIIDGMMETLTLKEALGDTIGENKILGLVENEPLNKIGEKLKTISIQDVMGKDVYNYVKLSATKNANGCYDEDTANGVETLCNPVYNGSTLLGYIPVHATTSGTDATLISYVDENGNSAAAPLIGCWKYLLVDSATGKERLCLLEDLGSATNNMTTNIQKATLYDLNHDGIITINSNGNNILDEKIIYSLTLDKAYTVCAPYYNGSVQKEKLGELTVSEAIDYISKMIVVVKPFSNH